MFGWTLLNRRIRRGGHDLVIDHVTLNILNCGLIADSGCWVFPAHAMRDEVVITERERQRGRTASCRNRPDGAFLLNENRSGHSLPHRLRLLDFLRVTAHRLVAVAVLFDAMRISLAVRPDQLDARP